jgi:hypothetical protein
VRLPDLSAPDAYRPRPFHPSSGYFPVSYADYSVPIGQEMTQRYITRHDLRCAGPPDAEGLCTPEEPIVYYLDPGTPEPVRSALLDGARWWNEAFTAAGFRDGFRVEMLPEGADPMDVRYSVIQWVHRATRGWSYGASIIDPRTGEILKGHVSLGSLRVRQDYLLAEGMLAPYSGENAGGFAAGDDPMLRMALARIRQLSAHEIGHTIGIAHNFAASANGRASVMDYPAPLATVAADGTVDLSEAYDTGIGAWDVFATRYGYAPLPEATERAALMQILEETRAAGLDYITDTDARATGGAHPTAHLWDNSGEGARAAIDALSREMDVREVAMARFGESVVRGGRPLAMLEEALVPLYLRHRYQAEAVAKLVGGVQYHYAIRGEGAALPPETLPAEVQREALGALLGLLDPEALAVPEAARRLIPPRPPGYFGGARERFDGDTGLTFDAYAPAEAVAALVASLLLHPQRSARLMQQADFDADQLSLTEMLDQATDALFQHSETPSDPYLAELRRSAQSVWVDAAIALAASESASPAVRARVTQHLRDIANAAQSPLADRIGERSAAPDESGIFAGYLAAQIGRFLGRDFDAANPARGVRLDIPPGSPIGSGEASRVRHADRLRWLGETGTAPLCSSH